MQDGEKHVSIPAAKYNLSKENGEAVNKEEPMQKKILSSSLSASNTAVASGKYNLCFIGTHLYRLL